MVVLDNLSWGAGFHSHVLKMGSPCNTLCGGRGEGHPPDAEIGHAGDLCKTHAEGC